MAASICSQTYLVYIVVSAVCTMTLADDAAVTIGGSETVTKAFTYVVGDTPDGSHADFGFSVSGRLPAGVSVAPAFTPETPDISSPTATQSGSVSLVYTVDTSALEPDEADGMGVYTWRQFVSMNTGTTEA